MLVAMIMSVFVTIFMTVMMPVLMFVLMPVFVSMLMVFFLRSFSFIALNFLDLRLNLFFNFHIIIEISFGKNASKNFFLFLFELLDSNLNILKFFLRLCIILIKTNQIVQIFLNYTKYTWARSKSWLPLYATPLLYNAFKLAGSSLITLVQCSITLLHDLVLI